MIIRRKYGNIICEVELMDKIVYTMQEIADMLGISRSYAYELVRNGTIPSLELGKKRVIPKEKFNKWVNGERELTI